MARGDVDDIGKHCQMEYCGRLDFLPFPCQWCNKDFCVDHKSIEAHKCPDVKSVENGTSTTYAHESGRERPCSKPSCKNVIDTPLIGGVDCPRCNRRYCMTHRHEEQHDCKNLIPIGARPSTVQQRTQSALSKLKLWAENKRNEDEKRQSGPKKSGFLGLGRGSNSSAAVSAQVELNALKRAAKGDAKVPPEKRIYLHVEASTDTTKAKYPTGKFFYSKDITVGRVLDMAAKALQVENVNNRGGGEQDKLRVFHVQAGRLLKFSEKIGDVCLSGNMIVLLRGVGDGEANLIDL
ncbi:uncharacterized protein EKO05_0010864 [Ascochyta rabiei]|uniref:Zinc ion binding n=1 Tax=Didymella rabiei TaxID=5454 RepID=A0A162ZSU2_DIDRA|nr:uncharacterized protein EKO05_0010864 [Ascochyta rabiei]KZM20789.1 zinc ion binding [Ascochyta rabiei]UPX20636.1 hypothetical protein EKO05_0010864 [Ascochyta rabiei]